MPTSRATLAHELAFRAAYTTGCMLEPTRSSPGAKILQMVVQPTSQADGERFIALVKQEFDKHGLRLNAKGDLAASFNGPIWDGLGWEIGISVEVG